MRMRAKWSVDLGTKVVLLGNSGAGKTSILQYQLSGKSLPNHQSTIGCQFNDVSVQIDDNNNQNVVLKVWDTAGQEVYRSIVPVYVRDSAAAILVFDVSEKKSFDALEGWRELLLEEQTGQVQLYIVANKIDLEEKVTAIDAEKYAERVHAKLFRCCAHDGRGISELFKQVAKDVGENRAPPIDTKPALQETEQKKQCC